MLAVIFMKNLTDLETIVKIVIGVIGAIATIGKLRSYFTNSKLKEEVKLDLEIFEKIKNNNLSTNEIEEKISKNITKAYENRNESFTNFLYGISIFVGFGFWTINLIGNIDESFNSWSILTLIISFIGLSIAFGNNDEAQNEKNNTPFIKIGIFEKTNFKFVLIIFLLTSIMTPILIWKIGEFSWWIFLSAIFFLMSVIKLYKIIKKVE